MLHVIARDGTVRARVFTDPLTAQRGGPVRRRGEFRRTCRWRSVVVPRRPQGRRSRRDVDRRAPPNSGRLRRTGDVFRETRTRVDFSLRTTDDASEWPTTFRRPRESPIFGGFVWNSHAVSGVVVEKSIENEMKRRQQEGTARFDGPEVERSEKPTQSKRDAHYAQSGLRPPFSGTGTNAAWSSAAFFYARLGARGRLGGLI